MADRTSAGLFGKIFTYLATEPIDERARTFAREVWKIHAGGDYDFSDYQMYCDEALTHLGLAKKGVDADFPDDGECVLYIRTDGTFNEAPLAAPGAGVTDRG